MRDIARGRRACGQHQRRDAGGNRSDQTRAEEAVVAYAAHKLHLHPSIGDVFLYGVMLLCGLAIHYSSLVLVASLTFWIVKTEGIEGSYFTLFEFSRMPRQAFRGITDLVFVYALPVVVVSNAPASVILHGFQLHYVLWLFGVTIGWFGLALLVFHRGLRRYASASS